MKTRLFEQGLELVVAKLRQLNNNSEIRGTAALLERIAQLRFMSGTVPEEEPTAEESAVYDPIPSALAEEGVVEGRSLDQLKSVVMNCTRCPHLVAFRHSVVFGVGNTSADLMFVGEAPGADEDLKGEPFVGRAGELLTKIIQAMGFQRADVYIANVLKCRPDVPVHLPGNRPPTDEEVQTCLPYLREQIELIRPKAIVALGASAMRGLLGKTDPMGRLRGQWHLFNSIPVMATFHPSYLMRKEALSEKRKVWEDMMLVMARLEMPISERQKNYFLTR